MNLATELYVKQQKRWPEAGRVILAQSDADSVVVYQAYWPSTGVYAAKHGYFGAGFSMNRMTWIKPNFLWMMYRSGWGVKEGQEVTLAIRLGISAFHSILNEAVDSNFDGRVYATHHEWKHAVKTSDVRLQWDPDHDPTGAPLNRRAIQLGLRGAVLKRYAREWILDIEDVLEFVVSQRTIVAASEIDLVETPSESVFVIADPSLADRLGLDHGRPH